MTENNNRTFYIYKITNNMNGKNYIGQRCCPIGISIEKDNYMGSGVYLHSAKRKYGIKNFSKEILAICYTKQEIDIAVNGTPNHLLVNKILEFPTIHFFIYVSMIVEEMRNRGYRVSQRSLDNFQKNYDFFKDGMLEPNDIFSRWHNDRYLRQCLYNLQEKYDCCGISECCWTKIMDEFGEYLR